MDGLKEEIDLHSRTLKKYKKDNEAIQLMAKNELELKAYEESTTFTRNFFLLSNAKIYYMFRAIFWTCLFIFSYIFCRVVVLVSSEK